MKDSDLGNGRLHGILPSGVWLTGLLLIIPWIYGQEPGDASGPDGAGEGMVQDTLITAADLFEGTDPLHVTLTLNLKDYRKAKYKEDYVPVALTYEVNDTLTLNRSVRIKSRGNFRKEHCQMAPFWLNLKRPDSADTVGTQLNKIKIVTHCKNSTQYDNYVLREYLAYRIYNLISPVSFRARLIRMTYVDRGRKDSKSEHWAFMIEPEELLAERFGALAVKNDMLGMRLMNPEDFDLMALYLYMIGNPDFSITGRHNVKILGLEGFGTSGYTPVPYDFDYSGLVNTYYAVPGENLGIETVRDRYFLGLCRNDEIFSKTIERINDHREEIYQLINEFPYLDQKEKSDMIGYLESYFVIASEPERLINALRLTCQ